MAYFTHVQFAHDQKVTLSQ